MISCTSFNFYYYLRKPKWLAALFPDWKLNSSGTLETSRYSYFFLLPCVSTLRTRKKFIYIFLDLFMIYTCKAKANRIAGNGSRHKTRNQIRSEYENAKILNIEISFLWILRNLNLQIKLFDLRSPKIYSLQLSMSFIWELLSEKKGKMKSHATKWEKETFITMSLKDKKENFKFSSSFFAKEKLKSTTRWKKVLKMITKNYLTTKYY
jgi:hypothetical protein